MKHGELLPSGERIELEYFLYNLSNLDYLFEQVKQTVSPEEFGKPLSYRAIHLVSDTGGETQPSPMAGARDVRRMITDGPTDLVLQWVDGSGNYLNRTKHVEVVILKKDGPQAEIYEFDDTLTDGFDECTERYRRDGVLPRYMVNIFSILSEVKPKTVTIYPDGSMLEWKYVRESQLWESASFPEAM